MRREAVAARTTMQLHRVACLLVLGKVPEARKLLRKLRPTLPADPDIDRWLSSLEFEGVPVAALRDGDEASAAAAWTALAQRWQEKNAEYWELVRSIAIASHLAALRAERKGERAQAAANWKVAVARWLELLDADEYWQAFARRAQDLFPGLDAGVIDEVHDELLDSTLAGSIRATIAELRASKDDVAVVERLPLLERIETWRLAKNPADERARERLAQWEAQRMALTTRLDRPGAASEHWESTIASRPAEPVFLMDDPVQEPAGELEDDEIDAVALMDIVTELKARGLSHDAIYDALVEAMPALARRDRDVVMLNIGAI